jgi:nicotinate-nucleotide pyrophosphorylase (carboxylating)
MLWPMDPDEMALVVARALVEDMGSGDVTTDATVPHGARATATITQKAPGIVSGIGAAHMAFAALDPAIHVEGLVDEGVWREDGGPVVRVEGLAAAILSAERTALNLMGRLSGIATLTARYVKAVKGTGATILDTRKTTPGLRLLEKQAVLDGGGANYRIGLFDAILIKENHATMAGGVGAAVRAARAAAPDLPLEVECRNAPEISEALDAGAPRILLDNMSLEELRAAVAQVDGRAETEASGGVDLKTVRDVAETGVQFISVGAITHSAPTLDLSLILELVP